MKIAILGDEGVPVQVDGEAWIQPPGYIQIIHKNRAQTLTRDRVRLAASKWSFLLGFAIDPVVPKRLRADSQRWEGPGSLPSAFLTLTESTLLQGRIFYLPLLFIALLKSSAASGSQDQPPVHGPAHSPSSWGFLGLNGALCLA